MPDLTNGQRVRIVTTPSTMFLVEGTLTVLNGKTGWINTKDEDEDVYHVGLDDTNVNGLGSEYAWIEAAYLQPLIYSDEAIDGVRRVIGGGYTIGYSFHPNVLIAIAAGLVYDADLNWQYTDMGARRAADLTPEGKAFALAQDWVCKCPGCRPRNPRAFALNGYCGNCLSSGNAYGWYDGVQCGMHWTGEHRDVLDERRRRKQTDWVPEGTVVVKERRR